MGADTIVRLTRHLRDAAHAEANQNARIAALGERRVPTIAIVVATLSTDGLVEIENVAT